MKITLCGSRKVVDNIMAIGKELRQYGHTVFFPTHDTSLDNRERNNARRAKVKKEQSGIDKHMNKIKGSDAILVANVVREGEKNYIEANTFMEMGYAHYLGKKIFALNDIPDQPYIRDEISSMNIVVLGNDVSKLLS